jgi:hypothetical protein
MTNWLWAQTGFGVFDMVFAPYVHVMLYWNLIQEAKDVDVPGQAPDERTLQARTKDGPIRVSRHDIFEAFKETFRGDPIIYGAIITLMLGFTWSILGHVWISSGGTACNPSSVLPLKEVYLDFFFIGFVLVYIAAWYYDLHYFEQDEVLTLRSGGDPAELGFHKPPPPPPVEEQPEQKQGLLSSWFKKGDNHDSSSAAHEANVPEVPAGPPPGPPKKGKCRLAIKLLFSMFLDLLGNATYAVPGVGEFGDAVFAPASAVLVKMLYDKNGIAGIAFAEEILPYTDVTPTATLAFFMENVMGNTWLTRCFGFKKFE